MPIQRKAFSGPVKSIPKDFPDEDSVEDIQDSLTVTVEVVLYPKICPPIFLKTFQEKFTSPTRRVIFRYSFAKISLITYSQIQVRLKSQFFKEGI